MSSRSPPLTPPPSNIGAIPFPSILPVTPKSGENESLAYSSEYQTKIAEQRDKYEKKLAEDTSIFGQLTFTTTNNQTETESTATTTTSTTNSNTKTTPIDLEGLKICSVRSLSDKSLIYNENTNSSINTAQSHEDTDNNDDDNESTAHINDEDSSLDKDNTVRDLISQTASEYNKKMFGIAKQKIGRNKHSFSSINKDIVSNRFLRMTQHHRNGSGSTTTTTNNGRGGHHRRRGRGTSKLIVSGNDEKKKSKIFNYREKCEKNYRNTFRKDNSFKEQQQQQQQQLSHATSQSESMDTHDELSNDGSVDITDVDEDDETIADKNEKLKQLTNSTTVTNEILDKSEVSTEIMNITPKTNNNAEISDIINLDSDDDLDLDSSAMEIDTSISNQNHLSTDCIASNTTTMMTTTTTNSAIPSTSVGTNVPSTSGISSSSSRRKTVHKPLLDHSNVIFEANRLKKIKETKIQIGLVKSAENPNEDLMKKIAFLRCCVSYMMEEFNRKPIQFQRGMTLNDLKATYDIRKDGKK